MKTGGEFEDFEIKEVNSRIRGWNSSTREGYSATQEVNSTTHEVNSTLIETNSSIHVFQTTLRGHEIQFFGMMRA